MFKQRGFAALAVALAAIIVGLGIAASTQVASANHATDPKELEIFHSGTCTRASTPTCVGQSQANLVAAVGQTFTVQANATVDAPTANGQQWMFIWKDAVLSTGTLNVQPSAAGPGQDLDSDQTSCADAFAPAGLSAGVEGIAGGCAAGQSNSTPMVSVPLTCVGVGTTQVVLAGLDIDNNFGSTLDTSLATPTTLEPSVANVDSFAGSAGPAPANVAAFTVDCQASVDISIDKTAPATANTGGTGTYVLTVSNPAATPYNVDISDAAPAGVTFTSIDNNAFCSFLPASASCTALPVPAAGSVVVNIGVTFATCGMKTNSASVQLTTGQAAADPNNANNTDGAVTNVDCPSLTVTKAASAAAVFTGDNVTYTINVANDAGSTAPNVTLTDPLNGATFVAAGSDADCAPSGPNVVCGPRVVAGGASTNFVIVLQMPQSAGQVCNIASATTTGDTSPNNSNQVCVTVNPSASGIVKDLDSTTVGFQGIGNLWICKGTGFPTPFAGADVDLPNGQANCNQLVVGELLFFTPDTDTCNDDDDGDGEPCAGQENPAAVGAAESGAACIGFNAVVDNDNDGTVNDGCPNNATQDNCPLAPGTENYIPGETLIDCDGGEVGEGLGAFEFQIKYDHKLFQQPAINCAGILDDTGRAVQSAVQVITENWSLFGCVTKNGIGGSASGVSNIVASNQGGACVLNLGTGTICSNLTANLTGSLGAGATSTSETTIQFTNLAGTQAVISGTTVLTGGNLGGGTLTATITGSLQTISVVGPITTNSVTTVATITGGTAACAAAATGQKIEFRLTTVTTGPTTSAVSGTYGSLTFWPVGLCGAPLLGGVLAPNGLVASVTLTIQPDLFQRIRPTKDNGVVTDILDENCEIADIFGTPFFGSIQGGLTPDCRDATITIRMLEGDVDLNCEVDIADDQAMAFRYGSFFGHLLYNRFYDLEPNIAPDFDIDIKDLQTVFGRNGSKCEAPIPTQDPNSQVPDP